MCDTQLMTGFAILISGFALLSHPGGPLSAYHWLVVPSLAWFSCVTHLSGLTVLRSSLSPYRWMKLSRTVLMFLLLVMDVVALIPTGYFNWYPWYYTAAAPQSPAVCYFSIQKASTLWDEHCIIIAQGQGSYTRCFGSDDSALLRDSSAMQSMVVSTFLLIWGFTTRCFKLFESLSRGWRTKVRYPLSLWVRKLFQLVTPESATNQAGVSWSSQAWMDLVVTPLFSIFLFLRIHADLFSSMLLEVYWIMFTLIWGTVKLAGSMNLETVPLDVKQQEKVWTYGQVIAVMLAAGPLLTMLWKFTVGTVQPDNATQDLGSLNDEERDAYENTTQHLYHSHVNAESSIHMDQYPNQDIADTDSLLEYDSAAMDADQHSVDAEPLFDSNNNAAKDLESSNFTISYLDIDYYARASWVSPFIWVCLAVYFTLTVILLVYVTPRHCPQSDTTEVQSLAQVWISNYFLVVYIFLGYPISCTVIITTGLLADTWIRRHRFLLFVLGVAYHTLYVLICFSWVGPLLHDDRFSYNHPDYIVGNTFLIAVMTYGLYVICYGARIGWAWMVWRR